MRSNILNRRWVTAAALGAAAVVGVTSLATSALFTDTKSVTGNNFATGSVALGVGPASALFSVPALNPGDKYTAPLTVNNTGSMNLRYAMKSTTTEDVLAAAVQMDIKSGVTTCDSANFGATGTAVSTTVLGSTAGTKVVGDAAQGAQAGDRVLTGAGSEVLCVQVSLPTTATNTLASKNTSATFQFDAEQVVNNP